MKMYIYKHLHNSRGGAGGFTAVLTRWLDVMMHHPTNEIMGGADISPRNETTTNHADFLAPLREGQEQQQQQVQDPERAFRRCIDLVRACVRTCVRTGVGLYLFFVFFLFVCFLFFFVELELGRWMGGMPASPSFPGPGPTPHPNNQHRTPQTTNTTNHEHYHRQQNEQQQMERVKAAAQDDRADVIDYVQAVTRALETCVEFQFVFGFGFGFGFSRLCFGFGFGFSCVCL